MIELAQQHLDSGRFSEAESLCRSILEHEPENARVIYMLSLACQRQGRLEEATGLMQRAAGLEPENANVIYALGTMLVSNQQVDAARECYLKALQINPFFIDAHNGLAFAELSAGNFTAAENAANLALTEDRNNVQALLYLGTAKLEQNDTVRAIAYLQEALKHEPRHNGALMQLGRAFMAAGNIAFATQCFSNIVEENPRSGPGWENLALAQLAGGDARLAKGSFRRALSLGRDRKSMLKGLADCERMLGNPDNAERIENLGDLPTDEELAHALARAELLIARAKPAAALKLLDQLEKYEGERVVLLKARAHEQMRNNDAALDILQAAIAEGGASQDLQIDYARLLGKAGRAAAADEIIDGLLALEHPPLMAKIFKGFQLCQHGDMAGLDLLKQVEDDPGLSEVDQRRVRKMLANTLDRAGRYAEAAGYYEAISGRMAQALLVAKSAARANREYLETGKTPVLREAPPVTSGPADPVFLFAWPGSGWEWLLPGFGAHEQAMLIADRPDTQVRRRELISAPAGPEQLDHIGGATADATVQRYWEDLKTGGLDPAGRLTLDSMWLSADMLPTIAALFPNARVIVVTRDPREMALDWLRSGYLDLEEMATAYADQRSALARYREVLNISFLDVDGGKLLAEPAAEAEKLLTALGLPWAEEIGVKLEKSVPSHAAKAGSWIDYAPFLQAPLDALDKSREN